jgi:hypothetical protein
VSVGTLLDDGGPVVATYAAKLAVEQPNRDLYDAWMHRVQADWVRLFDK